MAFCVGGKLLLLSICFLAVANSEQFEVLKISNVPFPASSWGTGEGKDKGIVSINATYTKTIPDYTICYRVLVESYNDGIFSLVSAYKDSSIGHSHILDRFGGMGTGYESEGLQGGLLVVARNVSKGGIGGKNLPSYHSYVFPKDIDISKWYHLCFSYSNTLNHLHFFVDGLKIFSFNFQDDSEPLPANAFEFLRMGHNFRGLLTDLQIHDFYMDESELIHTTTSCERNVGEVFSWSKDKVQIIQVGKIFIISFGQKSLKFRLQIKMRQTVGITNKNK